MSKRVDIQVETDPDVDAIRDSCRRAIAGLRGSRKELALAKSKLDEMIYWLRLARENAPS